MELEARRLQLEPESMSRCRSGEREPHEGRHSSGDDETHSDVLRADIYHKRDQLLDAV